MKKVVFLLLCMGKQSYAMEKSLPLHNPLTLEELRELQERSVTQPSCCFTGSDRLIKQRCEQETESIRHAIGKETYNKILKSWNSKDLESFIPFLMQLRGEETISELSSIAHGSLDATERFSWIEPVELLTSRRSSRNLTLTFYDAQALKNIANNPILGPKAVVGEGKIAVFRSDKNTKVVLRIPEFVAMAVSKSGTQLLRTLMYYPENN